MSEERPFFFSVFFFEIGPFIRISLRGLAGAWAYAYLQNYCLLELKKRITELLRIYMETLTGAFTQLHYVRQFQEGFLANSM